MKNQLSLDYSNSLSPKVLRLFDTSHYCTEVENYLIEVLPPGECKWVVYHVQKHFSLVVNASNLRIALASDADNLADLPDGIYEIRQSVKKNSETVAHYLHLRVTQLVLKLKSEFDKLLSLKCDLDKKEFHRHRDQLREIEEYVEAARFKVEEKNERQEGLELYEWAKKLLELYSNECQC